jgi:ankyrin repeat protein
MRLIHWTAGLLPLLLAGCRSYHPLPLLAAAQAGDVPAMEAALAQGAHLNEKDASGFTPLILAARSGSVPAVKLLLSRHADPDLPGGINGWTPLMHAIHQNQRATAEALLDGGARVDARGRSSETPLMMAAGYGYTPIVKLLLDRGADPRARTPDGATVFSIAVGGVPDIDRFTLGGRQKTTVQVLKSRDPALALPHNVWGQAAKLFAIVAKLRGCPY